MASPERRGYRRPPANVNDRLTATPSAGYTPHSRKAMWKSLTERVLLTFLPPLGYAYIRLLGRTMRLTYRGKEALGAARRDPGQYILAFWHSRFLMMPFAYPDSRLVVLSSHHRDAEILVRILRRFKLDISRGSTTRGGAAGLRSVLRKVQLGYDVGFTPDGPRGPRRRVRPGVIAIARLSGLPIIPVTFSAAPARRLRSWDRTLVPRPFSAGLFVYGTPLGIPRHADDAKQEELRSILESELDRITDLADLETGLGTEDAQSSPAVP